MDARNIGLRNIEVAGHPRYAQLMATMGSLYYRGYDILDLVNHSTYEESAYLSFLALPTAEQLKDFNRRLIEARGMPEPLIRNLKNRPNERSRWTFFSRASLNWPIMT